MRIAVIAGLIALITLLFVTGTAAAQGTGRSLDIDLSIRSSGMGGASNAVFWGGDPNHWANPALLGYQQGASYMWGRTQLVPGLASDVYLESRRYTADFGGIGVAFAGNGNGSIRLDYGPSEGADELGNPTGTFSSYEDIDSWSIGISLAELLRGWAALTHGEAPAITRRLDVGLGFACKDVLIALSPGSLFGNAAGTGLDYGLLVRVSPILRPIGPRAAGPPISLDLAYGNSVLNCNDDHVTFLSVTQASPLTRMRRNGLAGRFACWMPAGPRARASTPVAWLLDSFDPLIAIGVARDWEHDSGGGDGPFYDVDRTGAEIAVANVFTWRFGHVTDRTGDIDGDTNGWGLGLRLGRVAGFRYDHAEIPQARGLPDVERKGYTVFVDLIALLERGPAPY